MSQEEIGPMNVLYECNQSWREDTVGNRVNQLLYRTENDFMYWTLSYRRGESEYSEYMKCLGHVKNKLGFVPPLSEELKQKIEVSKEQGVY